MKRIKRFVLAENTEKDKNWKSSDNLLMRVSKTSINAKNGEPDAENTEDEKANHLSTLGLT